MQEIRSSLRVVDEVATTLHVSTSRIRNLISEDKTRPIEKQRLPSARKATAEEESALRAAHRIDAIPHTGILVIEVADVEALQSRNRCGGRPRKHIKENNV